MASLTSKTPNICSVVIKTESTTGDPSSNSPTIVDLNVLSCRLCSETFQDVVHLQIHTLSNHTNLLHESRTTSSSPLHQNRCGIANGSTRQTCTLCEISFDDVEAYGHHMALHFSSTNALYSCNKCASTFQFAEQFRRHFAMHHTDILYRCAVCLKVFTKRHIYEEHASDHLTTTSTFNCVICLRNFDKYNAFVEHLSSAHLDFCANSGQRPSTPFGVQNYFGSVNESNGMGAAERFLVERARKLTAEPRGAAVQASATVDAIGAAPVDGRLFRASTTSPPAPQLSMKGLKCSVCDEQFVDEVSLDEHRLVYHCMVRHGNACAICWQKLASVEEFVSHSLAHAEKAFGALSCVVCRQTIHGEPQIRMHAQYHLCAERQRHGTASGMLPSGTQSPIAVVSLFTSSTNEEDHVCDKCGEKFEQSDDLRTHVESGKHRHSSGGAVQSGSSRPSSKPSYSPKFYHCVKCSLRFNSMARLAAHQRLHHLKRAQFKCQICDDKFMSDELLKAHVKVHEMSIARFASGTVAVNKSAPIN